MKKLLFFFILICSFFIVKGQSVNENSLLLKRSLILNKRSLTPTLEGQIWNDTTQRCIKYYVNGMTQGSNNTLFTQTSTVTVTNTTTETSLVGAGIGSVALPANFFSVGKTIEVRLKGYLSCANGASSTINVKLGSVTLVTSTGTMPTSMTNIYFESDFTITCRAIGSSGTVIGQGKTLISAGQGVASLYMRSLQMTAVATVNTTTSNILDFSYTWGTASTSNSITVTNLTLDVKN